MGCASSAHKSGSEEGEAGGKEKRELEGGLLPPSAADDLAFDFLSAAKGVTLDGGDDEVVWARYVGDRDQDMVPDQLQWVAPPRILRGVAERRAQRDAGGDAAVQHGVAGRGQGQGGVVAPGAGGGGRKGAHPCTADAGRCSQTAQISFHKFMAYFAGNDLLVKRPLRDVSAECVSRVALAPKPFTRYVAVGGRCRDPHVGSRVRALRLSEENLKLVRASWRARGVVQR